MRTVSAPSEYFGTFDFWAPDKRQHRNVGVAVHEHFFDVRLTGEAVNMPILRIVSAVIAAHLGAKNL